MVELGCDEVFGAVAEKVKSLLGIDVSESQVYRCCQNVSELIEEEVLSDPKEDLAKIEEDASKEVYGMVDGSMLFTDDGWQETKLGRVFESQLIEKELFKWSMGQSQYVAKRGHYSLFTASFQKLLPPESKCRKIFITDGATWIGQWIKETYKDATHILDYFHVCEKLAESVPRDKPWLDQQKKYLLDGKVSTVIQTVKKLPRSETNEKLITYLENHKDQMDYKTYREKGWMIGSGPIESAHRTVLQVRMKRSGIRWADTGCDNMVKLRVAFKNGQRNVIKDVLKKRA